MQNAVGNDLAKVKQLRFGAKDEFNGYSNDIVGKASHTSPLIIDIDFSHSMQHRLRIVNNHTGRPKMPQDARQIDIYVQIGDDEPVDIKKMTYCGYAKNSKMVVYFRSEDTDKMVNYIAVYVNKKSCETSFLQLSEKDKSCCKLFGKSFRFSLTEVQIVSCHPKFFYHHNLSPIEVSESFISI